MDKNVLRVKKINEHGVIPQYQTEGAAGVDLCATTDYNIGAGQHVLIWTGIAIAVPDGFVGLVCPRSGLAAKHGLTILNAPGIIDSDYCGNNDEIGVILFNTGSKHDIYHVQKGDRIAQLVLTPAPQFTVVEVGTLENTDRGGFGSTGSQ